MIRHTPRYFVTKKWNFAPSARRKANRLAGMLEHARDHVLLRHDHKADPCGDCPALRLALNVLDGASRAVGAWADDQQREARLREDGVIGGRC